MYQIKRKKYNDDLIQFVDEIVTEYDYIFAKMKKRNDMTWKVRCSMCTILTTLGERQKRDEKIILIPRSKRFYSSSDNPIPEYLTFQAVQTAVLILQDKGIINFQKGYRTEGVESKTSSISLNSEYFSKDGLESYLKRISIFLPEANKSSVIRHKILFEVPAEVSKGLTFTRPTDHLTPREIYNLYDEADPVEWLEAEEKLLGLVPYDNRDIFNMFYRTQQKPKKKGKPKNKICVREEILQPSPKLERYNSFLVKEGLEKFKYRRIFSNNESWGGRFYSAINDIDRDLRKSLYRTEYTEVDFSSFSLNLIHLLEGEDKWDDAYSIITKLMIAEHKGLSYIVNPNNNLQVTLAYYRPVVKECINICFGSSCRADAERLIGKIINDAGVYSQALHTKESFPFKEPKKGNDETPEKYEIRLNEAKKEYHKKFYGDNRYRDGGQKKQFEKKHKDVIFLPMNKLFFKIIEEDEILSKYCFKSFWRISQRIESEILLNVLNYCVENDLLAFGIHDAVIVPSHSAEQVKEFMENELVKQVKLWKEKKQASEEAIKVYIENENTFFNKDKNLSFVDNFKIDVFDSSTEIKTFGNIKLPAYDFIYRTYLYNKIQKPYASMNS